jgi:hypothetical protein
VYSNSYVSDYDHLNGVRDDYALVEATSTTDVPMGIVSIKAVAYGLYGLSFISNPFHMIFLDVNDCFNSGACNLSLLLENNDAQTYLNVTSSPSLAHSINCTLGSYESSQFICPSGNNLTLQCDGTFDGIITGECPRKVTRPACANVFGTDAMVQSCVTDSYDGMTTICDCSVKSSDITYTYPTVSTLSSAGSFRFVTVIEESSITINQSITVHRPKPSPTEEPTEQPTVVTKQKRHGHNISWRYPVFVSFISFSVILIGCCCLWFCFAAAKPKDEDNKSKSSDNDSPSRNSEMSDVIIMTVAHDEQMYSKFLAPSSSGEFLEGPFSSENNSEFAHHVSVI